jgi:hypothetical protein
LEPLQYRLLDNIDQVKGAGNFTTSRVIEKYPIPYILVYRTKAISLPFRAKEAKALKKYIYIRGEAATNKVILVIDTKNILI